MLDFDPIDLTELELYASLLTRTDRKYIVSTAVLDELLRALSGSARVLEIGGSRKFRYESVYFDTPELLTYFDAARSRPRRFKVRTRTYRDSGLCSLEVKVRDHRGNTVKHRLAYKKSDRHTLTDEARAFLHDIIGPQYDESDFRQTLVTRYTRTTLVLGDKASRVTIDSDLQCHDETYEGVSIKDNVLIETKSIHGPTQADRLLWSAHSRPVRVSKYSTSLAALRPELPSNKWNVALQNYFERVEVELLNETIDLRGQRQALRQLVPKLVQRVPFTKLL